jgi:hypothetical protein
VPSHEKPVNALGDWRWAFCRDFIGQRILTCTGLENYRFIRLQDVAEYSRFSEGFEARKLGGFSNELFWIANQGAPSVFINKSR